MGLHTDEAAPRDGQYAGQPLNRCARLMAAANGGQIVMSDATQALMRSQLPDGATLLDLGRHRLRDVAERMRVFQIVHPDLPSAFPALASLDAIPNNLPIQLTELVGRQAELAEAEQLLTRTRLLTILAPGGAGKTRLAIQAAADIAAGFSDGVFFISLADIRSNLDIIQAIGESLGLALSSDDDVKAQLLTYLASKCQLLVFDNFEHLLAGAPLVTGILQAAPQVTVVVTSRAKLNVTGETVSPWPASRRRGSRRARRSRLAVSASSYSSMPPGGDPQAEPPGGVAGERLIMDWAGPAAACSPRSTWLRPAVPAHQGTGCA